jgi:ABC-type microcin C transport system permease subunit YejB
MARERKVFRKFRSRLEASGNLPITSGGAGIRLQGCFTRCSADSRVSAYGSNTGLTSAEVTDLRKQYGINDIPEEKKHPLLKFYALVSFMINDVAKVWLFRKIHPYS